MNKILIKRKDGKFEFEGNPKNRRLSTYFQYNGFLIGIMSISFLAIFLLHPIQNPTAKAQPQITNPKEPGEPTDAFKTWVQKCKNDGGLTVVTNLNSLHYSCVKNLTIIDEQDTNSTYPF